LNARIESRSFTIAWKVSAALFMVTPKEKKPKNQKSRESEATPTYTSGE
jgi:hypothetical protein